MNKFLSIINVQSAITSEKIAVKMYKELYPKSNFFGKDTNFKRKWFKGVEDLFNNKNFIVTLKNYLENKND